MSNCSYIFRVPVRLDGLHLGVLLALTRLLSHLAFVDLFVKDYGLVAVRPEVEFEGGGGDHLVFAPWVLGDVEGGEQGLAVPPAHFVCRGAVDGLKVFALADDEPRARQAGVVVVHHVALEGLQVDDSKDLEVGLPHDEQLIFGGDQDHVIIDGGNVQYTLEELQLAHFLHINGVHLGDFILDGRHQIHPGAVLAEHHIPLRPNPESVQLLAPAAPHPQLMVVQSGRVEEVRDGVEPAAQGVAHSQSQQLFESPVVERHRGSGGCGDHLLLFHPEVPADALHLLLYGQGQDVRGRRGGGLVRLL